MYTVADRQVGDALPLVHTRDLNGAVAPRVQRDCKQSRTLGPWTCALRRPRVGQPSVSAILKHIANWY